MSTANHYVCTKFLLKIHEIKIIYKYENVFFSSNKSHARKKSYLKFWLVDSTNRKNLNPKRVLTASERLQQHE